MAGTSEAATISVEQILDLHVQGWLLFRAFCINMSKVYDGWPKAVRFSFRTIL
jgi:hypothetical protein